MRFWTVRLQTTHYWDHKCPILFFTFCIIVVLGYHERLCSLWNRFHTKSKSQRTCMWEGWWSHKKALCWVFAPRHSEILSRRAETSCLAWDGSMEWKEKEPGWCPWSIPPSEHALLLLQHPGDSSSGLMLSNSCQLRIYSRISRENRHILQRSSHHEWVRDVAFLTTQVVNLVLYGYCYLSALWGGQETLPELA